MSAGTSTTGTSHLGGSSGGTGPSADTLAAALAYKARGWSPIFYPRGGKGPRETGWQNHRHSEQDFRRYAAGRCNVGVLLGPASNGLTDVDLDSPQAVLLAKRFLPDTDAVFGRASKREAHWIYYSDCADSLRQAAIQLHDPETQAMLVELRIGGGDKGAQTMFPGSVHPESGEPVKWDHDGEPARSSAQDLLRAVRRLAAASLLASRWAEPGGRHDDQLTLMALLARASWPEDDAVSFVGAIVGANGGDPDLQKRRQTYRDAKRRLESDRSVRGWPTFRERFGVKVAERISEWLEFDTRSNANADPQAWSNPDLSLLGTGRRPAPEFPLDLLGPVWSEWAIRRARSASAPPDYVAVALLASAGAAIANVRWPLAGTSWAEPPVLWCGLVGDPSAAKSPAMDAAFDLIRHAEDRLAAGHDQEQLAFETRRQVAAAKREAWQAEVKAAVKNGGTPPEMPEEARAPEAPTRPRIRVADATVEALGLLAAALPRGLLLVRDELAGWLGAFDKYGGGGADRAFAVEMYGGRSYVVDRVKNPEPIRIRHLSIGVLGGIQPDKLALIIEGPDDGLAARLLWTWPEALPDFTLSRHQIDDAGTRDAFRRLTELAMGTDEVGMPEPVRLRLTTEAENLLELFARDMAERARAAGGLFAGSLGKARGHALRLSAVLEHLWWCAVPGPEPTVISADAIGASAGLLDGYFVPMAERVFGDAAIPSTERNGMTLARFLRKNGLKRFNARMARREIGGMLREPKAMTTACEVLVEAGLIRSRFARAGDGKGRPAQDYEVNPAVHGSQA